MIFTEDGKCGVAKPVLHIREPGKPYEKEMIANAMLLAAAPDLLAASEYAIKHTIANGDAHEKLRAAIAKAEGGAR